MNDLSTEHKLRFTPLAGLCLLTLVLLITTAIFAPLVAPYGESEILSDESFAVADELYLLGSDTLGRDIASRLVYGLRVTLGVAFLVTLLSFSLGVTLGFLAAVLGGVFDTLVSRFIDGLIALPAIMLALIFVTAFGSSIPVLIFTVAFIDTTRVFRVARAVAMNIVVQDYVEAAKVRGERLGWILREEILPNAIAPLTAEFGIRFTYAILFISVLSFLGLGVQPPTADLGVMVKENMQGLLFGSMAPLLPALLIAVITLSINLLADWYLQQIDAELPGEL